MQWATHPAFKLTTQNAAPAKLPDWEKVAAKHIQVPLTTGFQIFWADFCRILPMLG
jgi:hypothetical protein